jgi:CheY-like chemotaxis protein
MSDSDAESFGHKRAPLVPPTILLVEDTAFDLEVLKRTFGLTGIRNPLTSLVDGEAAIAYLLGQDEYADREAHPLPLMLILDLSLPRLSGFDVLEQCGNVLRAHRINVVVLSGSESPDDEPRARRLGAEVWISKPIEAEALLDAMSEVADLRLLLVPTQK